MMAEADLARLRVRADRWDYGNQVALLFETQVTNGLRRAVGSTITFREVDDNTPIEPTITVSPETAQGLMDELWRCGFRPTEAKGGEQAFEAQRRHLEDMRALVFATRDKP